MRSFYWIAKPVIESRFYYADGTRSERISRKFVWDSLRPHPAERLSMWVMAHLPRYVDARPCGCVYWFHRQQAYCCEHFLEELDA